MADYSRLSGLLITVLNKFSAVVTLSASSVISKSAMSFLKSLKFTVGYSEFDARY